MEDLIPLIIVIAISIIAAIGRKKKRLDGQNSASPMDQNRRDDDILHWLEKFGVVEDEEVTPIPEEKPFSASDRIAVVKETPVEMKTPEKEVMTNRFSQYAGFISPEEREQIMAREGVSSVMHKKDEPKLTHLEVDDSDQEFKKTKIEFDLKQAVIFSEILNRKYV